ncbi:hypothetical protein PVA98_26270, partial [Achromobacter xylosoxidans]|nr:hypothetical protein [Achromobacter xylosoxidans]
MLSAAMRTSPPASMVADSLVSVPARPPPPPARGGPPPPPPGSPPYNSAGARVSTGCAPPAQYPPP